MVAAGARPGHVLDEARLANRTPPVVPGGRRRLLPRHGPETAIALTRGRGQGPQHVDRLDRRQRPLLGRDLERQQLRHARFLKTLSSHPKLKASRDNRWDYLGLVNEPCFEKATGPDPERFGLWLDKRDADCPPDPFENEEKYPGVGHRRARQEHAGRLLLRLATGIVGLRLFPNPDVRRGGRERLGRRSATTTTPTTTTPRTWCGPTGSACPAASATSARTRQAAGRPREPEVGEPLLERRRAVLLGRSHLRLGRRPDELHLPVVPHLAAGRARHLAGLHRLHQQPAHDERHLQPRRRGWTRRKRSGKETLAAAASTTSSSTTTCRRGAADAVLRSRPQPSGRRACSRTAPTRSARSARSTASISTSACSARSGCCTSTPLVGGKRSRRSRSRCAQELDLLAGHRGADARHGALLPEDAGAAQLADAPGGAAHLTTDSATARARQGGLRRALRALPLQQAAHAAGR